jgi:hypothetical protein
MSVPPRKRLRRDRTRQGSGEGGLRTSETDAERILWCRSSTRSRTGPMECTAQRDPGLAARAAPYSARTQTAKVWVFRGATLVHPSRWARREPTRCSATSGGASPSYARRGGGRRSASPRKRMSLCSTCNASKQVARTSRFDPSFASPVCFTRASRISLRSPPNARCDRDDRDGVRRREIAEPPVRLRGADGARHATLRSNVAGPAPHRPPLDMWSRIPQGREEPEHADITKNGYAPLAGS